MNPILQQLQAEASEKQNALISIRRALHEYPEVGWDENQTSDRLKKHLSVMGLVPSGPIAKHGFFVDIVGDAPGPVIAWRADMDALPINDQKEVPYKSKRDGFGHMCGHDVHSTIALGVTSLLHRNRKHLKGTVRVFWQPAEECNPSGAPVMIEEGILQNVSAVYGMHCDPTLPSGTYGMRKREETAAFDSFKISISTAHTTHSARPHTGRDTIWIAHQIMSQIYQISGRITDALHPSVISICMFHGGYAINVIPDEVYFSGTARSARDEERTFIRHKITEIAQAFEKLYDVTVDVSFGKGAPSVFNNELLFNHFRRVVTHNLGAQSFVSKHQSMGAEDFSFYTHEVPGLFIRVGTCESERTAHPLHSNYFDIDESVLANACAIAAYTLLDHLESMPLES